MSKLFKLRTEYDDRTEVFLQPTLEASAYLEIRGLDGMMDATLNPKECRKLARRLLKLADREEYGKA